MIFVVCTLTQIFFKAARKIYPKGMQRVKLKIQITLCFA